MSRKMGNPGSILLTAYTVAAIVFLFFPILIVIPMSFSGERFLGFPPKTLGLRWYINYFSDANWIELTLRSLRVGLGSSILASVMGTLTALALARSQIPFKKAITALFAAPVVVPTVIIALGVFIFAVRSRINDSELTLIAAHATIALPFVVMIVGAAARQVDPTYEKAARVLGAGPVKAFYYTTFRALMPAVISAAIFSFFVSFDELIIALFVMSENHTLPIRIWSDLRFELDPTIAAISTLLIVFTTAAMIVADRLRRRSARKPDA